LDEDDEIYTNNIENKSGVIYDKKRKIFLKAFENSE
jgi:hypothetical protein